jgi:hypothetical protein
MSRFAELLRAKRPETRNKELVFAVIYAEPKSGSWRSRDIGRVFVRRPGQVDNVFVHHGFVPNLLPSFTPLFGNAEPFTI